MAGQLKPASRHRIWPRGGPAVNLYDADAGRRQPLTHLAQHTQYDGVVLWDRLSNVTGWMSLHVSASMPK
jgi:hypothetical protein